MGDRYVLEDMNAGGFSLGGEQSGHLILSEHATTGDGLLTALHLMAMVAETGRPLAELASVVTRFPQVLINVRVSDKAAVAASEEVQVAVAQASAELGDDGPAAAAALGHRAGGPGDGRGRHRRVGPGHGRAGRQGRRGGLRLRAGLGRVPGRSALDRRRSARVADQDPARLMSAGTG